MNDESARLFEMVTPLYEVSDVVDWTAVEADYGLAFPADYKEFIDRFGAGTLDDGIFVSVPRVGQPPAPLTVGRLPADALQEGGMLAWQDASRPDRPDLQDMLVWGQTNGADVLCWVADGPHPDTWRVAVWARHGGGWAIYDCGMVEFLAKVLTDGFHAFPLSDASLRGVESAPFLNLEAENRLMDEGIDPWTGKPAPQMWDFD
ncbi:hypothetical protein ACFRSX_35730 [Streptomyces goshikiensis]|uniref:hypothetical protein n=2 Tax=Streptomyces TaxID=1883 RepID=UPI000C273887|nr:MULTISPECIES: hypothetical protein [unclassified Streptomyces]PJN13899.1 hypothetical protein CG724_37220 [Streptomyces sp. CB02120-2]